MWNIGASVYYLHSVLHDWPDAEAARILLRIKEAMNHDESRILIHDMILQGQANTPLAAQSDILMMAAFNARERTEDMWHSLFDSVGLKVDGIYSSPLSPQSIIVLRL